MTTRYNKVAILLHWLIAIAIIGMFALGFWMGDIPKEASKQTSFDLFNLGIQWQVAEEMSPRTFYFNLHKSIGITILALVAFRLFWRITHKAPAMLTSYQPWERKLATAAHHTLYLLMLAMPLTGLIMAINSKWGVMWFGMDLIGGLDNKPMRDGFKEAHEIIGTIMLVMIILHFVGALKHKLIDKDETMKRMSLFK